MRHAIERGRGKERVVDERIGSPGIVAVAGHEDRAPLIAFVDDLVVGLATTSRTSVSAVVSSDLSPGLSILGVALLISWRP